MFVWWFKHNCFFVFVFCKLFVLVHLFNRTQNKNYFFAMVVNFMFCIVVPKKWARITGGAKSQLPPQSPRRGMTTPSSNSNTLTMSRGGGGGGGGNSMQSLNRQVQQSAGNIAMLTGGIGALSLPGDASFNQVGFSPAILNVLLSFEELQIQLHQLLAPASCALTLLIQRLLGTSADLLTLAERNHHSGHYDEGERLLNLRAVIEATIDADAGDSATERVCGRGRGRLDNIQVLIQQVQSGGRELQRLAIRCRADNDFTGAQALDEVAKDLSRCLSRLELGLSQGAFSMLDCESGDNTMEGVGAELNEILAREGTYLIDADFVFLFTSGKEGHSLGSLAIVAGAGAVLRFIRCNWPGLTALSAPLSSQSQIPSHADDSNIGLWGNDGNNGYSSSSAEEGQESKSSQSAPPAGYSTWYYYCLFCVYLLFSLQSLIT
jgi:hypothetical protein